MGLQSALQHQKHLADPLGLPARAADPLSTIRFCQFVFDDLFCDDSFCDDLFNDSCTSDSFTGDSFPI